MSIGDPSQHDEQQLTEKYPIEGYGYEWWGLPEAVYIKGYDDHLMLEEPQSLERSDLLRLWSSRPA